MEHQGMLKEMNGDIIDLNYPLYTKDPTTERWFHSKVSSKDSEKMLIEHGKDGSFLVRESVHKPGCYVLSVRNEGAVSHIMIQCHLDGKFDIGGGKQFPTLKSLIDYYTDSPMVLIQGGIVTLKQPYNATRFNISIIETRMQQLEQETIRNDLFAGFFEEFEQLDCDMQSFSRDIGSLNGNWDKNRFKNILPIDSTRVILKDINEKDPVSSYINANYIHFPDKLSSLYPTFYQNKKSKSDSDTGNLDKLPSISFLFTHKPRYIATQGTLPNTVTDFWRMVWQEHSILLVMITKEVERDRTKCLRYWPNAEEGSREMPVKDGVLVVSFIEEHEYENFVVRELYLCKRSKSSMKEKNGFKVWHYHFLGWPDHGAPDDPSCVLEYIQDISNLQDEHSEAGPIIVHCSAGIGRTGTYIVIDMLVSLIKVMGVNCDVDIFKTVQLVREQRSGLVQTASQYQFVYKAVSQFIHSLKCRIQAEVNIKKLGRDYSNINRSEDDMGLVHNSSESANRVLSTSFGSSPEGSTKNIEL
ncbi:Tyrosine-protein phosphatase non-receptor type 6 [Cichlidogyrus casuarinus]|uniref:Tyrosine-protein phosphatase non-receptor type 6 n=1 Tax=Cichlidogyrus casuarinus TaxID=1844966 RepID=A0ABD2QPB4_9PLAT